LKYKNKYVLIRNSTQPQMKKNYDHSTFKQYKKILSIYFFLIVWKKITWKKRKKIIDGSCSQQEPRLMGLMVAGSIAILGSFGEGLTRMSPAGQNSTQYILLGCGCTARSNLNIYKKN